MNSGIERGTASEAEVRAFKDKYYRFFAKYLNKNALLGEEVYEVEDLRGKHLQVVDNKFGGSGVVGLLHIDDATLKMKFYPRDGVIPKQIEGEVLGIEEERP